ncbi:hypothetical protein DMENIID0001_014370 [Sergentomyia squamirostris]
MLTLGFIPNLHNPVVVKVKQVAYVGLIFAGIVFCLWTVIDGTDILDHTYLLFNMLFLFAQYQALLDALLFIKLQNTNLYKFTDFFNFIVSTKIGRLPQIRQSILTQTIKYGIIFVRLLYFFATLSTVVVWFYALTYTNYSSPMFSKIPYLPTTSILFYPVNVVVQTLTLILFVSGVVINDALGVVFVSYFNAEFDCISKLSEKLNDASSMECPKMLHEIYIAHKMAYELFSELKNYLWHSYLHKLVTACGYLVIIVYVLQFSAVTLAIVCSGVTVFYHVFTLCFVGQLNINSSESLSLSLYMTKWYEMSAVNQKRLMFMLRISQSGIGINSFGVDAISSNTFVGLVRAALSYAAILYTFLN